MLTACISAAVRSSLSESMSHRATMLAPSLTTDSRSPRPRPAMPMQATRMSRYFVAVVVRGLRSRFGLALAAVVVGLSVEALVVAGASAALTIPAAAIAAAEERRKPRRVISDLLMLSLAFLVPSPLEGEG